MSDRILVVDDTPLNLKLLGDLLAAKGYTVDRASSGDEALRRIEKQVPDLVLLDVVMPGTDGYAVCRALRARDETRLLPVVLVTALDPVEERVKGIEAGADDFLTKPIDTAELLARVRSLLRIHALHERVRVQAEELAGWSHDLEQRVDEQVEQIAKLRRIERFMSPPLARAIAENGERVLEPHRRRIAVVFIDLRGFTAFAEQSEPEELMELLREYHAVMGRLVVHWQGTLERFTGDGLMVFFNDPFEVSDPELRAVRMSLEMRDAAAELSERWARRGHELAVGVGISTGYATLGLIGFEGRQDYAAIGTVTNTAARICAAAEGGQVLCSEKLLSAVEQVVDARPVGVLELKGLRRPVRTFELRGLRGG